MGLRFGGKRQLDFRKTGFGKALRHAASKQHEASAELRARRADCLRRRFRMFVWLAGRVVRWHSRAVERAYAPGGLGFDEARASFEENARVHASMV